MTVVGFPILEQVTLALTDHALIFSASDPGLIRALCKRVASLHVYDNSYYQLARLRENLQPSSPLDGSHNLTISNEVFPSDSLASSLDVALMLSPNGRDLARAQLWSAFLALRPKGKLYIAGHNDSGVKTSLDDAT